MAVKLIRSVTIKISNGPAFKSVRRECLNPSSGSIVGMMTVTSLEGVYEGLGQVAIGAKREAVKEVRVFLRMR